MSSTQEVVERWVDYKLGAATRLLNPSRVNVDAHEHAIYSWGRHFEMGRLIGDGPGAFWLLNGDRYSSSTSRHQGQLRSTVERTGMPVLIVPFSALDLAGVIYDTIQPIEITPDQNLTHEHSCEAWADVPEGQRWQFPMTVQPNVENGGFKYENEDTIVVNAVTFTTVYDFEEVPYDKKAGFRTGPRERADDGLFHWKTYEHLLGEAFFSADIRGRDANGNSVTRHGVHLLSGFDDGERHGSHYFLCEIRPRLGLDSVKAAYESLKPTEVVNAEASGVDVVRQGDVFAVATDIAGLTDRAMEKAGWTVYKKGEHHLMGTSHTATRLATKDGDTIVRGRLYHDPQGWGRRPEHTAKSLGENSERRWYRPVSNTVPHNPFGGEEQRRAWSIVSHNGVGVD